MMEMKNELYKSIAIYMVEGDYASMLSLIEIASNRTGKLRIIKAIIEVAFMAGIKQGNKDALSAMQLLVKAREGKECSL